MMQEDKKRMRERSRIPPMTTHSEKNYKFQLSPPRNLKPYDIHKIGRKTYKVRIGCLLDLDKNLAGDFNPIEGKKSVPHHKNIKLNYPLSEGQ